MYKQTIAALLFILFLTAGCSTIGLGNLFPTPTSEFIDQMIAIESAMRKCCREHLTPLEEPYNIHAELMTAQEANDRLNQDLRPDYLTDVWVVSMQGSWGLYGPEPDRDEQGEYTYSAILTRCTVVIDARTGDACSVSNSLPEGWE
jgi:hypothetical protein